MGFYVQFWGTRGSIPTPGWQTRKYGGNTSCVELRINGTLFICDGGTGLRELGVDLMSRQDEPMVAHMFFSHPHWDHIQGFPFFRPAYVPDHSFYIYGTADGDQRHFDLLSGQMQSDYFPVAFKDLGAHIAPKSLGEGGRVINGVHVSWLKQVHPGGSYAFKFEHDGYAVVYATDNELDLTIRNKDETENSIRTPRLVQQRYIEFIRGADLLIADGQYMDDEYPERVGWGHPRATTVVDAAIAADVKRLAVFHHDPMQNDDAVDEKISICRHRVRVQRSDLVVFPARERVELRIDQPNGKSL